MIPQAYALQIQAVLDRQRYMVVGWRETTGETLRPVVVPVDDPTQRAVTLPQDVQWKVRTWA